MPGPGAARTVLGALLPTTGGTDVPATGASEVGAVREGATPWLDVWLGVWPGAWLGVWADA
jgi:hypothetical protein